MRALFISDVHLGTPYCEHQKLFRFLKSLENDTGDYDLEFLYLVGDILDLTDCSIPMLFNSHRSIIKKIFRMADRGVKVIYIPGNHDHFFRHEHNSSFQNGFRIANKTIHTTLEGERWLLTHGDELDTAIHFIPFAYTLGDIGYRCLYRVSKWFGWIRKYFRNDEFSLAHYIKIRVKNIIQFISGFEHLIIERADDAGVDGVICGHIHQAELTMIRGKTRDIGYGNCGCWTETGHETWICENDSGVIELWSLSGLIKSL